MACRFDHFSKYFPLIMKSAKSAWSSSIKIIFKTDHALLKQMYKKSALHGFGGPHAETGNVLKYTRGENAATFFDSFKYVQAKDAEPDGKATTRS